MNGLLCIAVLILCFFCFARLTADQAGLQKIAEKFKKYDFSALLLIGGFEVNFFFTLLLLIHYVA